MTNLTDTGRIRYIAFGQEVCPDTGHLHYQMYLSMYKPTRMSTLMRYFGTGHHFEPMRGTLTQNESYCSKESTLTKLGDEPRQGERHDLIGFKRKLDAGMQPLAVAEEEGHFGTYVKYHAGMEKYTHHMRAKTIRQDRTQPKVYIRIGEPGSGKSRWLDEQFGLDGWAEMPDPTGTWFLTETVSYSDTVVFNDVSRTQVPKINQFLKWTDRFPFEFNSKGGHYWWKPKNIVFTSNEPWTEWWPGLSAFHKGAVERRIFRIDLVYKDRPEEHIYPNGEDGVQQEVRQEEVGQEEDHEEGEEV